MRYVRVKCDVCEDLWLVDKETDKACAALDRPFDKASWFHGGTFIGPDAPYIALEDVGIWACPFCVEGVGTNAEGYLTAVWFDDDFVERAHFQYTHPIAVDHGEFDSKYQPLGDIPEDVKNAIFHIMAGSHSVRADAWRGYIRPGQPNGSESKWVELVGTWHSSLESTKFSDRVNTLGRGKGPQIPVIVVISRTSNVCAVGCTVYVREEDIAEAWEFLGEVQHH